MGVGEDEVEEVEVEKERERARDERSRAVVSVFFSNSLSLPSIIFSLSLLLPMLIVAWREMTSGDSGVSLVTSSEARSWFSSEVFFWRARRRRVSLIESIGERRGEKKQRKSKRPRSFSSISQLGRREERIRAVAWGRAHRGGGERWKRDGDRSRREQETVFVR